MLSPKEKRQITYGLQLLTKEMELQIIKILAEEIVKGGITETGKLLIAEAQKSGLLYNRIIKSLAAYLKKSKKEIKKAFKIAKVEQAKYDSEIYGIKVALSPEMAELFKTEYIRSCKEFKNFTKTTARAYLKAYHNACDKAYTLTMSNMTTWQEAVRQAVNEIGAGVKIEYASGYKTTPEVAVARSLRTSIAQTCSEVTAQRAAENGVTLFLTSAHDGARPSHVPWQGKVFWVDWEKLQAVMPSISVPNPAPQASKEDKAKYSEFVESTHIGEIDGLEGINCRHSYGPFFSTAKNPYEHRTYDNAKYYKEQTARKYEREIRSLKYKHRALKASLAAATDPTLKEKLQADFDKTDKRLTEKVNEYYTYCNSNEIKAPQEMRLFINEKG